MHEDDLHIDDDLRAAVKRAAVESGRTMTAVVEDALRQALVKKPPLQKRSTVRLTTVKGRGLLPGADLEDSASLIGLMESSDDAS